MSDDAQPLHEEDEEFEYILLDRVSRNFLGEWHTHDEAERTYLEYIAVAPSHVERLELWYLDKRIRVDPAKIAAVTAG